MKRRLIKKCVAILSMLSLLLAFQLAPVQAAEDNESLLVEPKIIPGEALNLFANNLSSVVTPMSFRYIADGTSSIGVGGNTIVVWGSTLTTQNVQHIGVSIYLQWYSASGWKNLYNQMFSEYNDKYVSGGWSCEVSSGYYYRVHAVHFANHNGITESGTTTTSAKYVQ